MQTIDNAIYDRIPDAWWSDESFMALLRDAINPARFSYFGDVLSRLGLRPADLAVLDVGCGGGLLAENFAALGCRVTGVDQSAPTLNAARAHASAGGLDIRYIQGDAARLPFEDGSFDVVCCCDVLEHVEHPDRVIAEISRALRPDGILLFDTINRTWRSRLFAIKFAQDWWPTRILPHNLHVWEKFIRPRELEQLLHASGMTSGGMAGLSPSANPAAALVAFLRLKLGRGNFHQLGHALRMTSSRDLSISYMGYARRQLPCTS